PVPGTGVTRTDHDRIAVLVGPLPAVVVAQPRRKGPAAERQLLQGVDPAAVQTVLRDEKRPAGRQIPLSHAADADTAGQPADRCVADPGIHGVGVEPEPEGRPGRPGCEPDAVVLVAAVVLE